MAEQLLWGHNMNKICLYCKKEFEKPYFISLLEWKTRKYCSKECRIKSTKGKPSWNKGIKLPYRVWNKGKKCNYLMGNKFAKGNKPNKTSYKKGVHPSIDTEFKRGQWAKEKHPMWKGGITPLNAQIRYSESYKLWKKSVFARDDFTCQECGKVQGWDKKFKKHITIHAHHLKPFSLFPKLRFEVSNGRTLCVDCHIETDTYKLNQYNFKRVSEKMGVISATLA